MTTTEWHQSHTPIDGPMLKRKKCEVAGCKTKTRYGYFYNPNPAAGKAKKWHCEGCYADAIRRETRATSAPRSVRCQVA